VWNKVKVRSCQSKGWQFFWCHGIICVNSLTNKKMKINSKEVLKTLEGEELKSGEDVFTMGKVLSEILLTDKTEGKMKLYALAQRFYAEDTVELDKADFALVKETVKRSTTYNGNALILGQTMTILEGMKEDDKK